MATSQYHSIHYKAHLIRLRNTATISLSFRSRVTETFLLNNYPGRFHLYVLFCLKYCGIREQVVCLLTGPGIGVVSSYFRLWSPRCFSFISWSPYHSIAFHDPSMYIVLRITGYGLPALLNALARACYYAKMGEDTDLRPTYLHTYETRDIE